MLAVSRERHGWLQRAPDGDGEVCVFTSGTTHVVVDVFGWFGDGFVGTTPTRVLDTRP